MAIDADALPLLPGHQHKTLDFGSAGVTASLSQYGRFLSIFSADPIHGQVVVAPWEQFPEDKLYDQSYVRQYRALPVKAAVDHEAGFGMSLAVGGDDSAATTSEKKWSFAEGSWPTSRASVDSVTTIEQYVVANGMVLHTIRATNHGDTALPVTASFGGLFSVHRAPYTQLTPQGICTIPDFDNTLVAGKTLVIHNRHLGVTLQAGWYVDDELQPLDPVSLNTDTGPLEYRCATTCYIAPAEERVFSVVYSLGRSAVADLESLPLPRDLAASANSSLQGLSFPRLAAFLGGGDRGDALAYIVLRNVDYLVGCCAIPVKDVDGDNDRGVCIIADHQCLPLGWNRDNYWQLRLLYDLYPHLNAVCVPGAAEMARRRFHHILKAHLRWVFDTAQRPHGYWARSFFVNGEPKDAVFQLDQQCYPLLELAEYAAHFASPDSPDADAELAFISKLATGSVDTVLTMLRDHQWSGDGNGDSDGEQLWLFKTDETPADDEVAFPYHFSSHVVLWRTLSSLAKLQRAVGPCVISTPVDEWATRVRNDTLSHFVTTHPTTGKNMFAYLTSTTGQYQFYHDANDLPTALAPSWGFCALDSQTWHNTLAFGFSTANTDGFYPGGKYGGLGSVHTRDPWPLGEGQRLVIKAQLHQDVSEVINRLLVQVQWDGLFSEAVDRHTGVVTSKHWFSWPGSFVSSALINYRDRY
ncbi:uncharacterized protein EHS24_001541 [Apiotrichum porosum]|uniref:Uncharacterized protein n=1 Tax=Apiotrichum porosum TaxID=105984 RepID=A0A427XKR4_9TREE|nr:uncharacterized protein EHS24_001541 [Apiotrichum porosum]RSH79489.1 hypothetical protein EHS24_001541 [Apiotrichum porosum]